MLILLFGVFAWLTSVVSATLVITSPTAGTTWAQGFHDITWTTSAGDQEFVIDIFSVANGGGVELSTGTMPSDLKRTTGFGGNLPPGQWVIEFHNKADDSVVARSGVFTITLAPTSTSSTKPTPTGSVTITNPKAGAQWIQSLFYDITWSITGKPDNFLIGLYPANGGTGIQLAANQDPTQLIHNAGIGGNVAIGTWFIAFLDVSDTTVVLARSPQFQVVLPKTTTTAPTTSAAAATPTIPSTTSKEAPTSTLPSSTSTTVPTSSVPSASSTASSSASSILTSSTPSLAQSTSTPITGIDQSSTSGGSTSAPSSTPTASDPSQANGGNTLTAKSSNTGAIVGGVVGGVAILILAGLFLLWYFRRRRQSEAAMLPMMYSPGTGSQYDPVPTTAMSGSNSASSRYRMTGSEVGPLPSFPSAHEEMGVSRPYNYDDPSTWPPSLESIQQGRHHDGPYDRHGVPLPEPM